MTIYKGSDNQSLVHKGSSIITNVYKGSTLVYRLGFDPVTFTSNGTWTVPAGIRQIRVDCVAAQGWSYNTTYTGGLGGRVQCILNVAPKQTLYIKVGKQHATAGDNTYDASDIRTADADLNSRLIVAGAGGGSGVYWADQAKFYNGGAGGGLTGGTGGAVSGGYLASSSAHGSSAAAAGGGSSYTHPTLCSEVVHTQGFRAGSGYITISMV